MCRILHHLKVFFQQCSANIWLHCHQLNSGLQSAAITCWWWWYIYTAKCHYMTLYDKMNSLNAHAIELYCAMLECCCILPQKSYKFYTLRLVEYLYRGTLCILKQSVQVDPDCLSCLVCTHASHPMDWFEPL